MSERIRLWKIEKRRLRPGKYLNSPVIVTWLECGVIHAADQETAAIKACFVVGSSAIRVSPVDEWYRPVSLLEG